MQIQTTQSVENAPDRRSFIIPFLLVSLVALSAYNTVAQSSTTSSTDYTTPTSLTPGAPSGSYALSGLDSVNLFNGNLNFHLPFQHVTGRGGAKMQMLLTLEQRWRVERSVGDTYCCHYDNHYPEYNWWTGIKPGYGPGVLHGRTSILQTSECFNGSDFVPSAATIVTRLTFTAADGTEYELRDQLNNGQPMSVQPCVSQGASRGTIFVSSDGNAATFVSDTVIYDNPYSFGEAYSLFYPSGYFLLRDGTLTVLIVGE